MHALLYFVPACLGTPIIMAALRGDLGTMLSDSDHLEIEEGEGKEEKESKKEE